MKDEELVLIKGGITTTLLNSVARIISVIFNIGKSIGTSIRMIRSKTSCLWIISKNVPIFVK